MENKYYLYYPQQNYCEGPYTFKRAMYFHENTENLDVEILMLVVDTSGRLVKDAK